MRTAGHSRTACVPLVVACLLALTAGGCGKEHQLQAVAKDWCMTIRASQIIPVYGLTEDLQPGDIFLVQVPIDKQQQIYKKQGYLPLDNHIARLDPQGYAEFYDHSFIEAESPPVLPCDWIHPKEAGAVSWEPAPHVAFPTYSFSVRRGTGLNLAVPVQGVPVGLSLLASDAADGSIAIKQARTIGVDILSLYREVQNWARANDDFLRYFGTEPDAKKHNYLRVVTRVFATGEIDVSLRASASQSGGLDAGVPKPVDLLFPELPKTAAGAADANTVQRNFTNGWKTLQKIINDASVPLKDAAGKFLPGGSLRLTGASARTVALKEQFQPPVILGYLGFDVVIYTGGVLGPPIPTYALLGSEYNFKPDLHPEPVAQVYSESALLDIYQSLAASSRDGRPVPAVAALDHLTGFIPDSFVQYDIDVDRPLTLKSQTIARTAFLGGAQTYPKYVEFRTKLSQSIRIITLALRSADFAIRGESGDSESVGPNSPRRPQIQEDLKKCLALRDDMAANNAYVQARSAALAQYLKRTSK